MVNLRHALTHARHGAWEQAHGMVQDVQNTAYGLISFEKVSPLW